VTPRRAFLFACAALALATTAKAQPQTVILVRHAEKATTPPQDPALSDAGAQRAMDLAAALASTRLSAVIVTQFQRTALTAKPAADANGLTPIVVRAGGPTQVHVDSVAAAVRRHAPGEAVLVVGHSNTIPAIVAALGGPKLPDLCDPQYSMLFIMEFPASGPPRLIRARFGAADPPDADGCARTMR